jgi:hypothetical protein
MTRRQLIEPCKLWESSKTYPMWEVQQEIKYTSAKKLIANTSREYFTPYYSEDFARSKRIYMSRYI